MTHDADSPETLTLVHSRTIGGLPTDVVSMIQRRYVPVVRKQAGYESAMRANGTPKKRATSCRPDSEMVITRSAWRQERRA